MSPVFPLSETDTAVLRAFVQSGSEVCRITAPNGRARGLLSGTGAGLLSVEADGGRWVVPPGHAIWVPPHRLHGLQPHGPFSGFGVYIAEGACGTLPDSPRVVRTSGLLREAVLRAVEWAGGPKDSAQRRIAEVVFDEIRALPHEPFGLQMPRDPRLLVIASGILDQLADSRGLEDWADAAAMAPRTLTRRFASETGFSLADWRQRARLMQAMAWLAAGVPVNTVAIDLGYDNVSAFIAMFRRTLGTTPGRYFGVPARAASPTPAA
jgi:AraC-like DNA-binding protein